MNSKDKKIICKRIFFIIFAIILLSIIVIYNFTFAKSNSYDTKQTYSLDNVKISNAKEINIDEIITSNTSNSKKEEIEVSDLNIDEILLLQDGHCFRDGILNLCKNTTRSEVSHFQLESGSFETLIKLADEGLGTTLLPYLHTLDLKDKDKLKLRHFKEPKPAREVSLIFPKNELKIQIIEALRSTSAGVIKGAIVFQKVQIISSIHKK